MSKKIKRDLTKLFLRYSILLIVALIGVELFYFIFKPLTVYPSYFLFDIFYKIYLSEGIIHFYNSVISVEIIGACVAGSAYLLFFILNLSTPNIKLKKRLYMLGISFASFLIINIIRIFLIGILFVEGFAFAEFAHKFFWYFGSIFMVIIIWFVEVHKFKIKEIPFYSDFKFLFEEIKKSYKSKRS